MDLIYADKSRIEQGVIQNFDVDFDTAGNKDFLIKTGIKNNVLQGGFWWYIEGTEYGGRIDAYEVITEEDEIQYTGKNFRGILTTKIIEPPAGQNYKVLSGTIQSIIEELISDAGMEELFVVDECNVAVSSYQFNRYISTYEGICSLAKRFGLVPAFMVQDGIVHISFGTATDYSDDNEYTQDDLNFSIKRSFSDVNHLICLGQGELKDRTVVHLYADEDGNISETQSLFGTDEVVQVYENTNAEDEATLKAEGIERLNELKNTDSFEVTIPDMALKIGDIIGGIERVTNTYVAREIVNIIAKISDSKIDLEYKVGEDSAATSHSSGGESSGTSSGGGSTSIEEVVKTILLEEKKKEYPIGKIVMSTENTNPADYLGFGTWEAWGSGRVPVGVNASDTNFATTEKTGGASTVKSAGTVGGTALTVAQLPSHYHGLNSHKHGVGTLATAEAGAHTHKVEIKEKTAASGSAQPIVYGVSETYTSYSATDTAGAHKHTITGFTDSAVGNTGNQGSGATHTHTFTGTETSVLQPYITCYMWKRTE